MYTDLCTSHLLLIFADQLICYWSSQLMSFGIVIHYVHYSIKPILSSWRQYGYWIIRMFTALNSNTQLLLVNTPSHLVDNTNAINDTSDYTHTKSYHICERRNPVFFMLKCTNTYCVPSFSALKLHFTS